MVNSVCCTVFQHFVKILFALNNTVLNSLDDIVDVYDRVYLYAKVFISLLNSSKVGVKSLFHSVNCYHHACYVYVCGTFELWH